MQPVHIPCCHELMLKAGPSLQRALLNLFDRSPPLSDVSVTTYCAHVQCECYLKYKWDNKSTYSLNVYCQISQIFRQGDLVPVSMILQPCCNHLFKMKPARTDLCCSVQFRNFSSCLCLLLKIKAAYQIHQDVNIVEWQNQVCNPPFIIHVPVNLLENNELHPAFCYIHKALCHMCICRLLHVALLLCMMVPLFISPVCCEGFSCFADSQCQEYILQTQCSRW